MGDGGSRAPHVKPTLRAQERLHQERSVENCTSPSGPRLIVVEEVRAIKFIGGLNSFIQVRFTYEHNAKLHWVSSIKEMQHRPVHEREFEKNPTP